MEKLLFIYLSMVLIYTNAASTTTSTSSMNDSQSTTAASATSSKYTESPMVDSSTISSTPETHSSTVNTETNSTDRSTAAIVSSTTAAIVSSTTSDVDGTSTEMITNYFPTTGRTTSSILSTASSSSTTPQVTLTTTGTSTTAGPTTTTTGTTSTTGPSTSSGTSSTTKTTTTARTTTTTRPTSTTGTTSTTGPNTSSATTTNPLQRQINYLNGKLSDLETERSDLMIAVVVLGAILCLFFLVLVVVYIRKRRKTSKSPFDMFQIDHMEMARDPVVKQGPIFRPSVASLGDNQQDDSVPLETFSRAEENKQRLSMLQTIKEGINSPAQYTSLTEFPIMENKESSINNTETSKIDGEDTENKNSETSIENKNGATAGGGTDVVVNSGDVSLPLQQGEPPTNTPEDVENIPPPPPHLQESTSMAPNHTESNGQISNVSNGKGGNDTLQQNDSQTDSEKSPCTQ